MLLTLYLFYAMIESGQISFDFTFLPVIHALPTTLKQHVYTFWSSLISCQLVTVALSRPLKRQLLQVTALHILTSNSLMLLDVTYSPIPIGMKISPITKNAGNTVPAVRIGCHAGKRCCLNAVLSGFLLRTAFPAAPEAPGWWPSSSLAL